jgi:hypothetical protein
LSKPGSGHLVDSSDKMFVWVVISSGNNLLLEITTRPFFCASVTPSCQEQLLHSTVTQTATKISALFSS